MFCLLRSNYFEMIIPYIDGPRLRASVYEFALTSLMTEGDDTLSDMDDNYIIMRDMLMNTEQGVMDDDEMRVIRQNETFTHYVLHMQEDTTDYAMEFDLKLLARFLSINIYIFSPIQDTNDFIIDNTETIVFKTTISPFNNEESSLPYITVVRRGSHYEPAMTTASGRAWLLCSIMQEKAHKQMNSFHDPGMVGERTFGIIKERPKHPRGRRVDIIDTICMRDIHRMRYGEFSTDATLDGFL